MSSSDIICNKMTVGDIETKKQSTGDLPEWFDGAGWYEGMELLGS